MRRNKSMKTNHLGFNLLYLQSRSPMFDNYYEVSRVGELWLLRLSFFFCTIPSSLFCPSNPCFGAVTLC